METPDFGTLPEEPKKKFPTWAIVVIVLVVLCCCCSIVGFLGWNYGDQIMQYLGVY